ncbi:hypothetical protein [Vagococcus luciliae]|uniref:Galactose-1-phosphate uridylyltransferase n=1 Tax=Vagococcus luciliae TaxID=2920380 RepID=A0ABY5NZV1_9ENTE|nr:hypothetical protein [Vagococcus luciliae]UUV99197.1 Galactose-1-phosphate uridylyltransferase [Vagococcus luciliae]
MKDSQVVYDFVSLAIESGGWMRLDRIYLQNKIAEMIGCGEIVDTRNQISNLSTEELCHSLVKIAKKNKPDSYQTDKDIELLSQSLMDTLTPPPSVVNAMFAKKFETSAVEATNYFYWLNQVNGYLTGETHEDYDSEEEGICPICFCNEGVFVHHSDYLKKTRRFIRLNLSNDSWGYQLNPTKKEIEEGIFFTEAHTYLLMNSYLLDRMTGIVDLYPQYELQYCSENSFKGHSYLIGRRPQKNRKMTCHQTLPFFKDSLLSYNSLKNNELVIQVKKAKDLWLIFSYIFSLTVSLKKGLFSTDFTYDLLKIDTGYQFIITLNEEVFEKSRDNWLCTMEILSNELEVKY